MLFESAGQGPIFLSFLLIGFCSGFLFDMLGFFTFLCKNNKIVRFFCDFIGFLSIILIFFVHSLVFCYGETRLFIIISFYLGFIVQRVTLGILLAKIYHLLYNLYDRFFKMLSNKLKRRKKLESKQDSTVG